MAESRELWIGIDSGGTKTEAVLTDTEGNILLHTFSAGCNPLDIGAHQVCANILSCVAELCQRAQGPVVSLYAGIAGADHVELGLEELIKQRFGIQTVRIEDDRRIVVSGTIGHTDGCGMICGTGSSLSIIKAGEAIRQVGGRGYLIDSGGSGFELGQTALKHALRYVDGRGPYTLLNEYLKELLGESVERSLYRIYSGGRRMIASLSPAVFRAAEEGDQTAERIIQDGSYALAELTYAAEKYFEGSFPVVMAGGIFAANPGYKALVKEKSSSHAAFLDAQAPPVFGALVEAFALQGIELLGSEAAETIKKQLKT